MKVLAVFLLIISNAYSLNSLCSLKSSMSPSCYHKRDIASLNVALIYYGEEMRLEDLARIGPILKERFARATKNSIQLNIIDSKILKYKKYYPSDFQVPGVTDPKRIQRIWYYETVGAKIMEEIYKEYIVRTDSKIIEKLDVILSITGAQFDGLGFASGRVSVTEYPQEIAWGLPDGGRVYYPSDYEIIDELIHELGHNMFLGHSSSQCQDPSLTISEQRDCCLNSPNKNDVLSYCRVRKNVDEHFMHGFEICNLSMIQKKIVPAILSGGSWKIKNRVKCL